MALDAVRDGGLHGTFDVAMPVNAREVAERERDFARTFIAGGIAVLTPTMFEQAMRRPNRCSSITGDVVYTQPSDISTEAVREAVADFREQLLQAIEDISPEDQERSWTHEAVTACYVIANLNIGPALDFAVQVGITPRILQPRFIVVLLPNSIRVAMVGYVGEPLIGERPFDQSTPFVVRLLTDNLMNYSPGCDLTRAGGGLAACEGGAPIHFSYFVRSAEAAETSIAQCVSSEVPLLLGRPAVQKPSEYQPPEQHVLLAGIAIPPEGVMESRDTTFFQVKVTPADGTEAWSVQRRYRHFREFYDMLQPAPDCLASISFPRKHLRSCSGDKLEARRQGLELWLSAVLREAQHREPSWLRPIYEFLEIGRSALAASSTKGPTLGRGLIWTQAR